jgi:hypothetical protein
MNSRPERRDVPAAHGAARAAAAIRPRLIFYPREILPA